MTEVVTVKAGRRNVEIKRPAKELFPGITKLDVAEYYAAVAPYMVPHVRGRAMNLDRYPDGIGKRGLFTQAAPKHFPDWIKRCVAPKQGGEVAHVQADDAATLVYLAGQAALALHIWTSRCDKLEYPDRLIMDFDPQVEDFDSIRRAAKQAGDLYRECGLEPFAMVTGSRGIHVVAPLRRTSTHSEVNDVARAMAARLVEQDPDALTTEFRIANRGDRIFVDAGRARYGHTGVAPYSLRAKPGAPAATPIPWNALDDPKLKPNGFTLRDLPGRLERDGDPWADIAKSANGLAKARKMLGL